MIGENGKLVHGSFLDGQGVDAKRGDGEMGKQKGTGDGGIIYTIRFMQRKALR
jgi:hypothetical protein